MFWAVVVNGRSSRQVPRSFSAGRQPSAIPSSFAAPSPIKFARAAKFGRLVIWPDSSSALKSNAVSPAALAPASAETFDIARALRMMSPTWSSKFIAQTLVVLPLTDKVRMEKPLISGRPLQMPEKEFLTLAAQFVHVANVVAIAVHIIENNAARSGA